MGKSKKLSYIMVGVVAVIAIAVVVIVSQTGQKGRVITSVEAEQAEITPSQLPQASELKELGLENSDTAETITDKFALSGYNIEGKAITYNYQASAVTSGWRLSLKTEAMTEAEYKAQLPTFNVQTTQLDNGIEASFAESTLCYVSDDFVVGDNLQKSIDEGKTELKRGNSISQELIPIQRMYWYKDGIAYTLESQYRDYTLSDMKSLVTAFLNNN
jgi:hypothetical protein